MGDKIGKITEVAGRVTGDREVEAKGKVEQNASDAGEAVVEVTDDAVEEKTETVRRQHHDID